jgi:hypothetical protein
MISPEQYLFARFLQILTSEASLDMNRMTISQRWFYWNKALKETGCVVSRVFYDDAEPKNWFND